MLNIKPLYRDNYACDLNSRTICSIALVIVSNSTRVILSRASVLVTAINFLHERDKYLWRLLITDRVHWITFWDIHPVYRRVPTPEPIVQSNSVSYRQLSRRCKNQNYRSGQFRVIVSVSNTRFLHRIWFPSVSVFWWVRFRSISTAAWENRC